MSSEGQPQSIQGASTLSSSQAAVLAPGTILNNRYLIEKELGRGGIGVVYLARDQQLVSRPVVVKVLLEDSLQNKWIVSKFRHEIDALSRVDHPNIVGIFDTGEMPEGEPYIVMQYVEGMNLRSALSASGMEFRRASNLFRQIGRALSAAHEKGVFHRDLKPENIMLQRLSDGDEQIKVIDFGIAKVKDSIIAPSTGTGATAGTVLYMSPEQLQRRPVTAASDTYAFGIIAYEVLTGRLPFNPESSFQLLEMQRAGVRIAPRKLRARLPEPAEVAILKALAFEATERHHKARDFGDELWRALDVQGTSSENVYEPRVSDPAAATISTLKTQAMSGRQKVRVAILYKSHAQPDETILSLLEAELPAQGYEVFVARHM